MTHDVELDQAQNQLKDLVREVMDGGDVTITLNQSPVVRLVAIPVAKGARKIGSAEGMVRINKDFKALPEGFEDLVP